MKRQAGLAIGLGVMSMGVSIYTAHKIFKLINDLNDAKITTKLVEQEFIDKNKIT